MTNAWPFFDICFGLLRIWSTGKWMTNGFKRITFLIVSKKADGCAQISFPCVFGKLWHAWVTLDFITEVNGWPALERLRVNRLSHSKISINFSVVDLLLGFGLNCKKINEGISKSEIPMCNPQDRALWFKDSHKFQIIIPERVLYFLTIKFARSFVLHWIILFQIFSTFACALFWYVMGLF